MANNATLQKQESRPVGRPEGTRGIYYTPRVDILETEDELVLFADVPGARPDSVDVKYENGELTLHARCQPRQTETNYALCEYGVGDFYRVFTLDESINAKQVTVLFADLKGSMELLADRDPEEARQLLDPVLERMMAAVHRYEGTVNQVMGDGIMALFGAPLAHEDHAVRACYAALAMQATVKQYAGEIQRTHGVPVQIRVGLNAGEVVVRADAPGFETEDFDIQVSGNQLTIRAEKKQEDKDETNGFSYSERRLHRSVTLPAGADPDKVEARYRNGVLEVHLPKSPEAQGKRITVKS